MPYRLDVKDGRPFALDILSGVIISLSGDSFRDFDDRINQHVTDTYGVKQLDNIERSDGYSLMFLLEFPLSKKNDFREISSLIRGRFDEWCEAKTENRLPD